VRSKSFFITSLLTPIIILVCIAAYVAKPNALPKHSEKDLVNDYLHISADKKSQLWYFDERRYSADFYSKGHVKTLKPDDDLNALSNNNVVDYIAVDKKHLNHKLIILLANHFKNIGTYREIKLYQECETQTACR
jgi:glucan biosynthesis protein